jgi:hypothetical protein
MTLGLQIEPEQMQKGGVQQLDIYVLRPATLLLKEN